MIEPVLAPEGVPKSFLCKKESQNSRFNYEVGEFRIPLVLLRYGDESAPTG